MMKSYVYLQACDGSIRQVEQEIAMVCPFICQEISQKGMGSSKSSAICLPQEVSSSMLNSILEYCQFHVVQGCSDKERKLFDEKFVTIPAERLYELASAANSLKLRSLVELTCRAIARTLERSSPEEICDKFNLPIEKLEPFINITCDPSIVLLNRLKRNKLKERERVLENVGVQEKEEHVADERPIEEFLSFINGSNDGEIKEKKTSKNIIKNRTKKKHQQKNSSLTSSNSLSA